MQTINNCYILVFALDDTVKFIADLSFSKLLDVFIGNLSSAGKLSIGFVQEQFYTMKRKVSSKIQIYENQWNCQGGKFVFSIDIVLPVSTANSSKFQKIKKLKTNIFSTLVFKEISSWSAITSFMEF